MAAQGNHANCANLLLGHGCHIDSQTLVSHIEYRFFIALTNIYRDSLNILTRWAVAPRPFLSTIVVDILNRLIKKRIFCPPPPSNITNLRPWLRHWWTFILLCKIFSTTTKYLDKMEGIW